MIFPVQFFVCNIFISLLLGIILLFKKIFQRHLTPRAQYQLWYLFLFALMLPFLPYQILGSGNFLSRLQERFSQNFSQSVSELTGIFSASAKVNNMTPQDFSLAIASSDIAPDKLLWSVWIIGILIVSGIFCYTMRSVYQIRKNARIITGKNEPELYHLYMSCMQELHIRRTVHLFASCQIVSPVSYGFLFPKVMIPEDLDIHLAEKDIRFIFLHELQHYKQKDAIFNHLTCILQALYWFNPMIWYGFHLLKKDREISCDYSVLHIIGKEESISYGHTILRYAQQMQQGLFFSPLSSIGGSKKIIQERIIKIADYQIESTIKRFKSLGVLFLTFLILYGSSPFLTIYAATNVPFHLAKEEWTSLDLSTYFQGMDGSFVLYDMSEDQYQIYNKGLSEKRISPDSTFKIYSALFALEEGIISPSDSILKWDQTPQPFDTWNQDQTLRSAMQYSVNWYFQNLDRTIGLPKLSSYYQKISYGNSNLNAGIDSYWQESSLKISPVEQVRLLSDFLQNKWSFKEANIQEVKDALFISDTAAGKLYGKTGTGQKNNKNVNGWFVGFLERNEKTYCFATNLQRTSKASGNTATEITLQILNQIFCQPTGSRCPSQDSAA